MANETFDSSTKLYSAPRRFDLATILVVTLAYAVLFGALRLLHADHIVVLMIAGLISCVGVGQALLFQGKRPRLASLLIGVVVSCCVCVIDIVVLGDWPFIVVALVSSAVSGLIFGYLAGVAVGSVFLVSDLTRRLIQRFTR
jgi:uncharacterized membrane protein